jgi:hypothetical protein
LDPNRLPSHLIRIAVATFLVMPYAASAQADHAPARPALNADQIVARLMQRNSERAEALAHYTGQRRYHLDYKGFPGSRDATMEVNVSFDAPASRHFTVTSETGSNLILNRVFRRLLESEQQATDENNQKRIALTTANYTFSLAGIDGTNYVLNVEPKQESKYLYRGRIWVDGQDFAVTRIDAAPAKNPSFWIAKSEIQHTYERVGSFYLPKQNKTVTNTRLGGVATLTIEYLSYNVTPCRQKRAGTESSAGAAMELDHTIVGALAAGSPH